MATQDPSLPGFKNDELVIQALKRRCGIQLVYQKVSALISSLLSSRRILVERPLTKCVLNRAS
jgi:hypothetical protein